MRRWQVGAPRLFLLRKGLTLPPCPSICSDAVAAVTAALSSASQQIENLPQAFEAHEKLHRESCATRAQVLRAPHVRNFLASYGFEVLDEDHIINLSTRKPSDRDKV